MSRALEARRRQLAYHQAGQAVVHHFLQRDTDHANYEAREPVSIQPQKNALGHVRFQRKMQKVRTLRTARAFRAYVEDVMTATFAGPEAEKLTPHLSVPFRRLRSTDQKDVHACLDALQLFGE